MPTDIRREYVAGGGFSWLSTYYKALPHHIDDVTADFGDDLYDRMMCDPVVNANINTLKLGVLANGQKTVPTELDETDPNHDLAQEISDFCQRNLDRLETPAQTVFYQLLDAMAYGHKIAELVFELVTDDENDPDYGKICLKAIKVKPRRTTAIIVDAYYNVQAIQGVLPGQGFNAVLTYGYIGGLPTPDSKNPLDNSLDSRINLLPREKFVIHTNKPKDGDPRGTSLLRSAYNSWWSKKQLEPEYLKYLAQFGTPTIYGFTSTDARNGEIKQDADGNHILDASGNMIYTTPEEVMLSAILDTQNGSAAVFTNGSSIQPLEMQGNGEPFLNAFQYHNEQIALAITNQTLATQEGANMSRAASETHQDTLANPVRFAKLELGDTITRDIFRILVLYNYGPYAARNLCPSCVFPETEQQDFATDSNAISSLQSSGYLHDNQKPGIDAKLGLPARDMEAMQAEKAQSNQMKLQQLKGLGQSPQSGNSDGDTKKDTDNDAK